jgi:acetoin utilization deacetylase AcuC-like enzyme
MHKQPGVLFDRRYYEYNLPRLSLENADRLRGLYRTLEGPEYRGRLQVCRPRQATAAEIAYAHSPFYLEQLRQRVTTDAPACYDQDAYLMEQSLYAAGLAAGGCLEMADRIMAGDIDYGFALIRPPGHHAEPGRGVGFCVFNNVAITAEHLRRVHGLERILILDFDVHHGSGTQSVFYDSDQVVFVSIHQQDLFPYTGLAEEVGCGKGQGYTINLPTDPLCADPEYMHLLDKVLSGVAARRQPQMILVSAGFDGHCEDPISTTLLTTRWYAAITELLKHLARETCEDRLMFVLEGGYNPAALEESVLAVVESLLQPAGNRPETIHSERAARILERHPLRASWTI